MSGCKCNRVVKKFTDSVEEAVSSILLKRKRCWLFEDISSRYIPTPKSEKWPNGNSYNNKWKNIGREGDDVKAGFQKSVQSLQVRPISLSSMQFSVPCQGTKRKKEGLNSSSKGTYLSIFEEMFNIGDECFEEFLDELEFVQTKEPIFTLDDSCENRRKFVIVISWRCANCFWCDKIPLVFMSNLFSVSS